MKIFKLNVLLLTLSILFYDNTGKKEDKLYPFFFRFKKFDLASFAGKQYDFLVYSGIMYPETISDDNELIVNRETSLKTFVLECSPIVNTYSSKRDNINLRCKNFLTSLCFFRWYSSKWQ